MSYYGHPYVITPQGYYYAPQQGQQAQLVQHAQQQQGTDLALEERQALAYLQSVRRRREAAEAAMALETKERQRAQAEREKALRAAAERHNALIQASRRERAIREALERERQREAAFQQALQAHQAQQVQASIEAERRRQTQAAEAYARALAEHRQRAAPRQTPAPAAPIAHAHTDDDEVDLDGINALLGQLFGFNLATEPTDEPPAPKPKKEEAKKAEAKPEAPKAEPKAVAPTPAPAPAATPKAAASKEVAPKEASKEDDTAELPEDLNALLNQFLGLNVGPAAEGERGNPKASQQLVGNAVGDLNSFLAQYGLEFVPESESESEGEDEAPKAEVKKDDGPKPRIVNEAGWAALPSENDKNDKNAQATTGWAQLDASNNANARSAATTAALASPAAPAADPIAPATPKKEERPRQAACEPDEEAPFTSTLGSYQDLPPYLRDVLSQMEAAMCDEHSDACSCDTTTNTPCAHGLNGQPCAAHRKQKRRERAIAKKRASKNRRDARRAKKYGSQEEKDAAGIPYDASPDDTILHHDVYSQAAVAGHAVEHEVADANVSAEEARNEAIPKGEPGWAVDEHRSAAAQAAAVGTSQLHEPKPIPPPTKAAIDAKEAKKEAIPAEATPADVAAHREVAGQAAVEGAAELHSQLHANAADFHPKSEKKQKQHKDLKPSGPEAEKAIQKLNAISQQLHATRDKFTFPRYLSFSPSLADATQPPLLYTRNNHAYHAQAHSLMQLLLAVDDVQSHGDKAVRHRRKEVVAEIQGALNDLEKGRDAKWAEVKERRERGESDDDDGWVMTGDTTDVTSDVEG
ncbi:uncharacterized protein CcaverHIS019_0304910 [Cutaneotrichosporon cavernicola]|uniref:BAG domain-containing protein n=1 Tax=Cutaneotrichosporon cavernicola TaxID=279322 RepID=A0AA48IFD9_9TREE|nr:uncharacterized protein CcaverHIS019_0304910 [Cutaneotrichosporon cavernicola]BEI90421.1 hypothetical protein CcaverHIS019_0304910 [Cutaneotrichosporon cavernicola]BEI98196.1 hypothetical protein CcaverHIS631_0304950 [Cutaneotrichosporon cavernicola]BEJ05972.1 hypothetical protein CcaverHIS641_0304940 [Cutaneotrichosporon cavernicola]